MPERAVAPSFEAITRHPLDTVERLNWEDSNTLTGVIRQSRTDTNTFSLEIHENGAEYANTKCGDLSSGASLELCSKLTRDGERLLLSSNTNISSIAFKNTPPIYDSDAYGRRAVTPVAWSSDHAFLLAGERLVRNDWSQRTPKVIGGTKFVEVGDEPGPVSRTEVSILDISGQKRIASTLVDGLVSGADWFRSQRVYFSAAIASENRTDIFEYISGSQSFRRVYSTAGVANSLVPRISPDGKQLALVLNADNMRWGDFQSLVLVDVKSGKARRVTTDIALFDDDFFWSADGESIIARFRHGGFDSIVSIDLSGRALPVRSGPRRHYLMVPSPDRTRVAYLTEDLDGRSDVRVYDLGANEEKVELVTSNPATEYALSDWEQITWGAPGDVNPSGFLIYPPEYDSSKRYPMIVDVHGGGGGSRLYMDAPITIGVNPGPLEWHAWAALGYLIFVPDYRTTGAYGPAPITKMYRERVFDGLADAQDVISGVEHLIEKNIADPSRIALLGHSAGGRRVFMALHERSDLFAAAILNDPIAPDPESFMYFMSTGHLTGGSGLRILESRVGVSIAEDTDQFSRNYLFDAWKIKTPTLIMMGDGIRSQPHAPYEILFSILRRSGTPSRFIVFADEGHAYLKPDSALFALETIHEWLSHYCPPE